MNQIKQKRLQGFYSLLLATFFLLVAGCCFFDQTFQLGSLKFQLGLFFLGVLLSLFTYLVVFKKYKKTLSKLRFFFALEAFVFVFVIVTAFLLPGLGFLNIDDFQTKNPLVGKLLTFNYCLSLMFVLHSFINLNINYFKKQNFSFFILYLLMFGFGCFGLGSNLFENLKDIILKSFAFLSLMHSIYLTFIGIKQFQTASLHAPKKENENE
ncbi:hypothetical protein HGD80_03635 [Paulownia witches'-broom phytoplasma]|uniref:Uncharacterized protein n=1 Tax=Paulownia witches'-broom phytoplasma TaxID=39647 RepID=A0ABX8TN67_9MOLU|nr:hypothetical protein [Paulownia witches'-broom phytoplasma]QYC30851.1 hypothetical protein HGD80_03635 [Paulownia witches'-broom phytoplasma]GLH60460.1 hypothetical protein PAWBP_1980 [Paulownia witches'-broom phytoplasma]